jgi:hypothetical protein
MYLHGHFRCRHCAHSVHIYIYLAHNANRSSYMFAVHRLFMYVYILHLLFPLSQNLSEILKHQQLGRRGDGERL